MIKKITFKLHLYLGLAASLVLLIVALSGAMLSYEKEILRIINPNSFSVTKEAKPLEIAKLLERFQEQKPEAEIRGITLSGDSDASHAIRIASKKSRKGQMIYINPYTAEILPEVSGVEFFRFIQDLHRRLTFGEVGKQIVGASTVILIMLLFSGIYLYMPKIKRGFINSLKLNKKAKGVGFITSLHSAAGMWVVPIYLTISLTGLYWSYSWYNSALFAIAGVEKPDRSFFKKVKDRAPANPKEIQEVFDRFDNEVRLYQYAMLFIPAQGSEYRVFYLDKKPAHIYARNSITIDSQNMQIKNHERYDDKSVGGKFMASMLALHSGEFFGSIGQLIMFLASLAMPIFAITGLMLYIKKRNLKKKKNRRV